MPDDLLRHIFERLEAFPQAAFWESELRAISGQEFERLKQQKMLQFVQTDIDEATYPCPTPAAECTDRVLMRQASKLLAVCPCPAEEQPIELALKDIRRWEVDVDQIVTRFHETNGLQGTPGPIEERLFYLGEAKRQGLSVAIVLALIDDDRTAVLWLANVPKLVPANDRFVAVCPRYIPGPVVRRTLEGERVHVVPLGSADPFLLDLEGVLVPGRSLTLAALTQQEERECEAKGLRSRLTIHISGHPTGRGGSIVEVGGAPVELSRSRFRLFLRLVVGLFEGEDGFVFRGTMKDGGGLIEEGYYAGPSMDPVLGRLREPFRGHLGSLDPKEFIEASAGHVRLSTHRRCVTWNADRLRGIQDKTIQELVGRLQKAAAKATLGGRHRSQDLRNSRPRKAKAAR